MRIDKYLKVSRLIKRRTVAHDACEQTRIYINDKAVKPSAQVKPGDEVMIVFGNSKLKVRVVSTPEHVLKDQASELYEVINEQHERDQA
ncbi:MAG: RNA-binding S4 domain-containing protein [Firmicutes bacterium]|nr:RNA-binding S4 domain-containing protein [Bacillota bacterium]